LADHAEDRTLKRSRGEVIFGEVDVVDDDTLFCCGVVGLDDALHGKPTSRLVDGFGDLAGLYARRARIDAFGRAIDQRADALNVRIPPTFGAPMGVAHGHTERWMLATHIANRCHNDLKPRTDGTQAQIVAG